jgi:NAD-dependent SIR2 family protein deacetylase
VPDGPLKPVPGPLLEELNRGRWLPIIGAGFSKNAEIPDGNTPPDWKELGVALARDVAGLEYNNPLDTISAYEHAFGRVALVDTVSRLIRVHDAQPGRAHAAFARLGFQNVVTTNFDMLLERAYDNANRPCLPL